MLHRNVLKSKKAPHAVEMRRKEWKLGNRH
jgi:hypothetical protein